LERGGKRSFKNWGGKFRKLRSGKKEYTTKGGFLKGERGNFWGHKKGGGKSPPGNQLGRATFRVRPQKLKNKIPRGRTYFGGQTTGHTMKTTVPPIFVGERGPQHGGETNNGGTSPPGETAGKTTTTGGKIRGAHTNGKPEQTYVARTFLPTGDPPQV